MHLLWKKYKKTSNLTGIDMAKDGAKIPKYELETHLRLSRR